MHSDSLEIQSGLLVFIYFIFSYLYYYKVDAHIKNGQLKKKKNLKKIRSAFEQVIPLSQKLWLFKVHVLNIVISGTHQPQPPTVHTFC